MRQFGRHSSSEFNSIKKLGITDQQLYILLFLTLYKCTSIKTFKTHLNDNFYKVLDFAFRLWCLRQILTIYGGKN